MLKVGLTGGLASGKSYVAGRLKELGCHVISADRLGHEVLRRGNAAYENVIRAFGDGIVGEDGEIDRKKLGNLVFGDAEKLQKLNSLVHPHVFRLQEKYFAEVARQDPAAIVISEAAIMIEAGSYKRYDRIVLAVCPREMQIERYLEREGGTREEAGARLARQMPLEDKRKYADYVIDTSGAKQETDRQVREVYRRLKEEVG